MFLLLKRKNIICAVIVVIVIGLIVGFGCLQTKVTSTHPSREYTIVIDAGHGGRDNGCIGVTTGLYEADINLAISKYLGKYLENQGFKVVFTRTNQDGLYQHNADNFKLSDMNKRVDIITKASADMVISIHQNSFEDSTLKGAQVFYQEGDTSGESLANIMQTELDFDMDYTRGKYNHSDLYLLKETGVLGVLIECGYLTNSEDEANLSSVEYQKRIAYSIMCGVVRYFISVDNIYR